MRCANCNENHRTFAAQPQRCLVKVLFVHLVNNREELTDTQALELLETLNVDALFDDLGPVLDNLRDGRYNV